jgi:hypothetical protein
MMSSPEVWVDMVGSATVYLGLVMATAGLVLVAKPIPRLRITTRWRGLGVAGAVCYSPASAGPSGVRVAVHANGNTP